MFNSEVLQARDFVDLLTIFFFGMGRACFYCPKSHHAVTIPFSENPFTEKIFDGIDGWRHEYRNDFLFWADLGPICRLL